MLDNSDLADKLIEYMDMPDHGVTFNDFFDWVGIPENERTDFLVACIVNQALEKVKE